MKTLLFLRGCPGTGKHTVGKILAERLGWKLFWLHDIDSIYKITGEHRLPRLQDEVSCAILKELFRQQHNVIFVRAAREGWTVQKVKCLADDFGWQFVVVRLHAEYETLLKRVRKREPQAYRICDEEGLSEYIESRMGTPWPGEHPIRTDKLTPSHVADQIITILEKTKQITV